MKFLRSAVSSGMSNHTIHWAAPVTILLALTAGVAFSIGHHFFYNSLHGQTVAGQDYNLLGSQIPSQQLHIIGGTAFAFLVNFSLGTALATVYSQIFWRAALRGKTTLEGLDATFHARSNGLALFKVWFWRSYPVLFCFAVVTWLIPIASTITPGTLSVDSAPVSPPPMINHYVPNVGFESLNYVNAMPHSPDSEDSTVETRYTYSGPSQAVQMLVNDVATTGAIQPIAVPFTNASWTLSFPGPGLKCTEVPPSMRSEVQDKLLSAIGATTTICTTNGYFAWTSVAHTLAKNITVSFNSLNHGSLALNMVALPHMMGLDPQLDGHDVTGEIPYLQACSAANEFSLRRDHNLLHSIFANSTMIQCQLRNFTYHTSFKYLNGAQSVDIRTELLDDPPILGLPSVQGYGVNYHKWFRNQVDCTVLSRGYPAGRSVDPKILRRLSYQAILDALANIIGGEVSREQAAANPSFDTSVQNTVLAETSELKFLKSKTPGLAFQPLQDYIAAWPEPILFRGLVNDGPTVKLAPLSETIERLFENITISMMSSPMLRPNPASAFAPPLTQVTLNNFHNIYVYSAMKLWIPYGIAILITSIGACVGLWSIALSKASYSDNFSTVFRVARGALLTVDVDPSDLRGEDPVPLKLKVAPVCLGPEWPPKIADDID